MFNGHWVRARNQRSAEAMVREQELEAQRRARSAALWRARMADLRAALRRIFRR